MRCLKSRLALSFLKPAWVVSIAVGLALGIWLYFLAVNAQLDDVASSLADDCRERRIAVQSSIDALRSASLSMAAVVGAHPPYGINMDIFSQFVAQSTRETIRTSLARTTWVQRVYHHERAEWEAHMSAEFGANITIAEMINNGSITVVDNHRVSPVKPVYFPLTYPVGFDNGTLRGQTPVVLVGVDLISTYNTNWEWIFNDVINSSTELMTIAMQDGYARCTVAVYNISNPTVDQRSSHARGVIIMYLSLEETFTLALKPFLYNTDMKFAIVDQAMANASDPNATRPLTTIFTIGTNNGDASDKVGSDSTALSYGGRVWTLTCTPTTGYVKSRTNSTPVAYLCGLLALGILLALLFRRITAITTMAQQLADATSTTTQFLSFICHEIRNPLHAIVGMNALLGEHDLTQEQRECVTSIASSAQLMAAIVNDVLDLNKIQAGKLNLTPVPFDLHDMVKDLQEVYHLSLEAKTVNWTTSLGPGVPRIVVGDSTRLRQMLANLISNAFKFTRQGSICLSLEVVHNPIELQKHQHYHRYHHKKDKEHTIVAHNGAHGGSHVSNGDDEGESLVLIDFKVTDTGMGIAPDQLKELFKPYSHAHSLSDFGGTGLGLSIVRLLAEAMGGSVRAESEQGKGSCFAFRLAMPRVDALSAAAAATATSPLMGGVSSSVAGSSSSAHNGVPSFTQHHELASSSSSVSVRSPNIGMTVITGAGSTSSHHHDPNSPSSSQTTILTTRAAAVAASASSSGVVPSSSSSSSLVVVRPQQPTQTLESPPQPIRWHLEDGSVGQQRGSGSSIINTTPTTTTSGVAAIAAATPIEGMAPSAVALSIAMAPSSTTVALQAATAAARLRAVDRNAQTNGSNDSLDSRHSHSSSGDGKLSGGSLGGFGELMPSIMESGTEPKTTNTTGTMMNNSNNSARKANDSGELVLPEGWPPLITTTSTASNVSGPPTTTNASGPPSPDPPWRQMVATSRHALLAAPSSTMNTTTTGTSTIATQTPMGGATTQVSSSSAPLPRRMLSPMGVSSQSSRAGALPPLTIVASPRRPPSSASSATANVSTGHLSLIGVVPEAYSPQPVSSSVSTSATAQTTSGSTSPGFAAVGLPPIITTPPGGISSSGSGGGNPQSSSPSEGIVLVASGTSPASSTSTMATSPVPTPSSTPHAITTRLSPLPVTSSSSAGSSTQPPNNTSPTPSPVTPSASLFLPIRVLLVEDNLVNRKLGLRVLAVPGITADWAIDGIDALEKCGCGDVSHLIDGVSPPPSALSQPSSGSSSASSSNASSPQGGVGAVTPASGGWMTTSSSAAASLPATPASPATAVAATDASYSTQLAVQPQRYDLILMDVEMPRMNGIRCTRELRARGLTTPIVALTANAMADQRAACMAAGCTDFVTKPFEPEALRVLIVTLANIRVRSDVDISGSPTATTAAAAATNGGGSAGGSPPSNSGTRIDDDNDREATLRALRVRQLVASWAKPGRTGGGAAGRSAGAPAKSDSKTQ